MWLVVSCLDNLLDYSCGYRTAGEDTPMGDLWYFASTSVFSHPQDPWKLTDYTHVGPCGAIALGRNLPASAHVVSCKTL